MNRLLASLIAPLALGAALAVPAAAQDAPVAPAVTEVPVLAANPDLNVDRENILFLDLSNGRRVAIRLVPQWAPGHVARVKELARSGFYNGVIFHRVIDGFMAQTGDPTGTGQGGSELPDLTAEFNRMPHVRGSVSMARLGNDENSANSQFFIVFYPRFSLDRNYTNFGRVISGMDAVDAIERGEPPANPTRILQATIAADNIPQLMPTAPRPLSQAPAPVELRSAAGN
ncbi:peptidylprolyl isomerase [Alteraurantiacibacter buctensis]|uniref:Peptidyl-prolyl cis-trans isomerase n=1 Tax=Alteraurantiacibacter buctensis TaxID=1503981 RepID=A0A844YTQ0_9SPHN|nr:peptidylprolyl isomerase [Alteraurantiacibacter buctensis]MXO71695.1 peptidylprolyl isomerase [Alteraurantiacibacter buctensis]